MYLVKVEISRKRGKRKAQYRYGALAELCNGSVQHQSWMRFLVRTTLGKPLQRDVGADPITLILRHHYLPRHWLH